MRIIEIFHSRQGEGIWTGTDSVFVRVFGCPLRCRFCDTAYTQDGMDATNSIDMTLDEIIGRVTIFNCEHVVLTGGEPMLADDVVHLTRRLKERNHVLTIETAGIADADAVCDLMSVCPKLSNSTPKKAGTSKTDHESRRHRPDIVAHLVKRYNYQIKFVVDTQADLPEIESYLSDLRQSFHVETEPDKIVLMPQAVTAEGVRQKETWLEEYCGQRHYYYSPRMQILWYGNKRKT